MKVCLVTSKGDWKLGQTGKGKFAIRLGTEFEKMGIEVTSDTEAKSDIALHFGKMLCTPNAKKQIVRMGPAHVDTNQDYKKLNKRKAEAIRKADGVVYQSQFSKRMCDKFLGEAKCPTAVIFNGADPEFYEKLPYATGRKWNFLVATRTFTKQKRLKYVIKAFKQAAITDSCLWIAGKVEKKEMHDDIKYLGLLSDEALGSYHKSSHCFINICYADACSNAVAEALVSVSEGGKLVICCSQSGNEEMLGSHHAVINDKPWDFKPISKWPKPNVAELVELMKASTWCRGGPKKYLHIDNIAMQYRDFFNSVLEA